MPVGTSPAGARLTKLPSLFNYFLQSVEVPLWSSRKQPCPSEAPRDWLREVYLDGPADLVVEVVSPSSGPRDRGDKFYEYEAGGVPEYWLVDPARVYRLKERRYQSVRSDDEGLVYSEAMPGFWLKEAWLWQDPLPRVLNVLKRWKVL